MCFSRNYMINHRKNESFDDFSDYPGQSMVDRAAGGNRLSGIGQGYG